MTITEAERPGKETMRTGLRRLLRVLVVLLFIPVFGVVVAVLWLRVVAPPPLPQSKLLTPVNEVKATAGRGQVTVTWSDVPGAVSYQVLRSDLPDRDFDVASSPFGAAPFIVDHFFARVFPGEPFGRLPHSPFVDTSIDPGHTYYYRVRGNDGTGWSGPGATAQATVPVQDIDPGVNIRVDAGRDAGTLEHKWELVLGSEHLSYMLNGDIGPNLKAAGEGLRGGNKLAHDDLGIKYIRAHDIFSDKLGVYREDAAGNSIYDWSGIDRVYDMVRADGLKPFVELGFMPKDLASDHGPAEIFFYKANNSPPKDYAKWAGLVSALAKHLIERYGKEEVESWPFEVWNEPDLRSRLPVRFWRGSDKDYFRLYDFSAQALKSVDPKLQVGGPVAALSRIEEPFLQHVTSHNYATGGASTPIDFLDVHVYSMPAADWRPLLERYGLKGLPIYYSEWGVSAWWNHPVNDSAYGAAWIANGLHASLNQVTAISYWTASDYFEEQGPPKKFFYGGFGLIGIDNIRKPRYWAYYLLHQLGTGRIALEGDGDGFGGLITGWATRNDDGGVKVLLSNVTPDQTQANGNLLLGRMVSMTISDLPPGQRFRLQHFRVDDSHSNVYKAWQEMGQPDWPTSSQLAELHRRDDLEMLEPSREIEADEQGRCVIQFEMPMPSLSLLVIAPSPLRTNN